MFKQFSVFDRGNFMFRAIVLLLLSSAAIAQDLKIVTDPDIAENGWYWLPEESGFGLNVNIQPANFVESGYFMFGSIFTYDDEGQPIWYTYQGAYEPNTDVYAWREGRGPMGSITSPLFISTGGNSPTAPYSPSQVAESSLGEVTLTWTSPLDVTMTIGNTTKNLVYQYWHAGVQNPDSDWITDGAWYIQAAFGQIGFKGLTKFERLDLSEVSEWTNFGERLNFDPSYNWYTSFDNTLTQVFGSFGSNLLDEDAVISTDRGFVSALLAFNPQTREIHFFDVTPTENGGFISACNEDIPQTAAGILKPAVGTNTRLYFSEGVLDNCGASTLSTQEKRQVFVSMTRIPQGGDDMASLPAFQNRE